jgi:hypothetical protein
MRFRRGGAPRIVSAAQPTALDFSPTIGENRQISESYTAISLVTGLTGVMQAFTRTLLERPFAPYEVHV